MDVGIVGKLGIRLVPFGTDGCRTELPSTENRATSKTPLRAKRKSEGFWSGLVPKDGTGFLDKHRDLWFGFTV